ncbi:MAG: crossover junction endodeoxyribonuclease RuvC [Deltaproteobacteria bacterium]|nr:MAG: crossover junction endodeoxyribonuclease RuvC [Deltaproteobacteria bacterium]
MIILGIDPGSVVTGWGVVETRGANLRGIDAGALKLGRGALEERLVKLFDGLSGVIEEHTPDQVAVEDIFFAKYPNAALKLGHARGVALLVAARAGLSVAAYPPAVVKRTVAGRGRADKTQVAQLVAAILGWQTKKTHYPIDATDALAIAITHARAASALGAGLPTKGRRARKSRKAR